VGSANEWGCSKAMYVEDLDMADKKPTLMKWNQKQQEGLGVLNPDVQKKALMLKKSS
jgi:hypothetical protein